MYVFIILPFHYKIIGLSISAALRAVCNDSANRVFTSS
ncbi:hypothetical protein GPUN_1800 [Glaciecola punicea ACAM 611]|uniref:Uncharacterized protein n=1 Tax=Glaciecola punicea ACAM 611 TaxID=1121923 RepID=H5TC89_9ALTE|nr:hypothetical protein GPUN_1800 [Glaciecola punicea ACAM 611]